MASRVTLEVVSVPAHNSGMILSFTGYSGTSSFPLVLTFINGVPVFSSQIPVVNDDLEATWLNFFLILDFLLPLFVVTGDFPFIYIDYPEEEYEFISLNNTAGAITINNELLEEEEPEPVEEFEIKDFSIQVIDTYDNDRPLNVELARRESLKLIFDSGDSIFEPIMASELKFSLRVNDSGDAFFKHLFTGDEKRFKVKVNAIDADENINLLWQGFLLPDLYREPYVKGNLFVEFSATYMLATLKNKFFKPWEYFRKINIMRLFSEILKETGVSQKFYVAPGIVPANDAIPWYYLNLELKVYSSEQKGDNLYEILTSVLQSNLLTIRSFEGFWYIEAVNRKFQKESIVMLFDEEGNFMNNVVIAKKEQQLNFIKDTLNFEIKSPLKNVKINFTGDLNENLFPNDIVNREAYFGRWNNNEWDESTQKTSYLDYWVKVGAPYLVVKNEHRFVFGNPVVTGTNYQVTEAIALNNYFRCKYRPFVMAGKSYRFKMEVQLSGSIFQSNNNFTATFLPSGGLRHFFLYQILLNNVEVYSNRMGFGYNGDNLFFINPVEHNGEFYRKIDFILDFFVNFSQNGYLELRILAPSSERSGFTNLFLSRSMNEFDFEVKKIELLVESDDEFNLIAERPVNFTSSYEQDLKIVSNTEEGNSANLGLGLQLTPYQQNIPVGTQTYVENIHTFNSNLINKLFSWRFEISDSLEDILFKKLLKNSVYVTRADGSQEFFNSLYTLKVLNANQVLKPNLYYLTSKIGYPKYPKEYKFIDKIEVDDVLTILLSNFPNEDFNERLRWKIYAEGHVQNYIKSIAKVIHQMHPDNHYQIEGTLLGLFFPGEIMQFYYDDDFRDFVASRLEIDLFNAKTVITGREIKYQVLNDISYE